MEIKHFGPVLKAVWQEFGKESPWYDQLSLVLDLNNQLDQILDSHPVSHYCCLPKEIATQFLENAMAVAQVTKVVSQSCKASGINAFSVTSKAHDLIHIAMLSKYVHPILTSCFDGEDYMRVVQRLVQSCIRGNNFWQTPVKATSHYRLAMHLRFTDCQ